MWLINQLKKPLLLFSFLFLFSTCLSSQEIHQLFCKVIETEAAFGKGNNDWNHYVQQQVNFNIPVLNCAPPGKYYVEVLFLIGRNGQIEMAKPKTSFGFEMEAELVRVIKASPPWIPATRNGRNVRAYHCQTFIFEVDGAGSVFL